MNVLFFIKKAKLLKNGEASVCMRITMNGARVENNIRMSIEPALWNQASVPKARAAKLMNSIFTSSKPKSSCASCSMNWRNGTTLS